MKRCCFGSFQDWREFDHNRWNKGFCQRCTVPVRFYFERTSFHFFFLYRLDHLNPEYFDTFFPRVGWLLDCIAVVFLPIDYSIGCYYYGNNGNENGTGCKIDRDYKIDRDCKILPKMASKRHSNLPIPSRAVHPNPIDRNRPRGDCTSKSQNDSNPIPIQN